MAFTEDLDVFLADFGVSCTAGAVTAKGILDMPSQIVSDGMVLSTDYTLTARTSNFRQSHPRRFDHCGWGCLYRQRGHADG
jgi:hypothetical protein